MIKRLKVTLFILSTILLLQNCTKDSTTSSTTKVAFTYAPVKAYFDSKCASCHSAGKSYYNNWPYDASDYEGSIKAYSSKIYNSVVVLQSGSKAMPPDGKTDVEKTNITTWKNLGYPATN